MKVLAFNVKRGACLPRSIDFLSQYDVLLLSEVDKGMARTGNKDIAKEVADMLGYHYVFAAEFHELTKGIWTDGLVIGDNTIARHGNAILSKYPLQDIQIVKLPELHDWSKDVERREGHRNAIIADIDFQGKKLTLCCTHLENKTDPYSRARCIVLILDEVGKRDQGQLIIFGGDINTSGLKSSRLWLSFLGLVRVSLSRSSVLKLEPLFSVLTQANYHYFFDQGDYTYPFVWPFKVILDWIFVKNIDRDNVSYEIIKHTFGSDHFPVAIDIADSI